MKTVLKWNPYLKFEIAAQEQWLEEMAHDGLFFHSRLGYLTWFQTGNPAPFRRFRLEPVREGDPLSGPSPDMAELFWQAGWRYEGFYCQSLYYLFFTDDPEAPEPYTDPETKALALEGLRRHFWGSLWKNLVLNLLSGLYLFVLFPKLSSGVSASLSAPLLCFYLASLALELLLDVAEWRGMRRTCRRLEEGETAPLPPARRLGLLKGAVTLAGLLLLILTLALIIAVLPLLILEVPL